MSISRNGRQAVDIPAGSVGDSRPNRALRTQRRDFTTLEHFQLFPNALPYVDPTNATTSEYFFPRGATKYTVWLYLGGSGGALSGKKFHLYLGPTEGDQMYGATVELAAADSADLAVGLNKLALTDVLARRGRIKIDALGAGYTAIVWVVMGGE